MFPELSNTSLLVPLYQITLATLLAVSRNINDKKYTFVWRVVAGKNDDHYDMNHTLLD